MQAILLATAKTNKLHPLTETIPSPTTPVAGRPIMAYSVELLARQGCKRIHVSLYNSANYIEAYFKNGSRWGINLEYFLQPSNWGSAGSIYWARQHLTETFIVMPADILIDLDLDPIFEQHRANKSVATMIVARPRQSSMNQPQASSTTQAEGESLESQQDGCVETGVYVFDPSVLKYIPSRTYFDISTDLIPTLISANLPVNRVMVNGYWNPLETFSDYLEAQKTILESAQAKQSMTNTIPFIRYPSLEGRKVREGVWVGNDTSIHPLARLRLPILIGNHCFIRSGVELGPHTVIGNNVIIDEEATVTESTVLDHTYVGQLVNLESRIVNKKLLIDVKSGEKVYVSDQHLLSQTYREIGDSGLARLAEVSFTIFLLLITLPITLIISCLLLLTNGRVFRWHPRIHMVPSNPDSAQEPEYKSFRLLRFITRNATGQLTWPGKLLEKSDLFRLPELWNIIKGDIQLVGVKPLSPEENSLVREAWQKTRYEIPPGFTGLWYLQTTPDSHFDDILVSDAYYAATRNWSGDLKIVYQSFTTWVRHLLWHLSDRGKK